MCISRGKHAVAILLQEIALEMIRPQLIEQAAVIINRDVSIFATNPPIDLCLIDYRCLQGSDFEVSQRL